MTALRNQFPVGVRCQTMHMQRIADYLDRAAHFERMAAEADDPTVKPGGGLCFSADHDCGWRVHRGDVGMRKSAVSDELTSMPKRAVKIHHVDAVMVDLVGPAPYLLCMF
jgi:hypothetical protein